jgi:hypothetical protein
LAITAAVFALWHTPVVVPIKILVVFLHEMSHAAAAWLTGGSVEQISVSPRQGGFAITRGGNRFAILSAGYLGSLLMGVALLLAALRGTADRAIIALLGASLLLVTALYVRDLFAAAFCGVAGVLLLLMARHLGHRVNDLMLRVIGLTSIIYVPYDIFEDTIARAGLPSDARMLAQEFGGTTVMWGALWLVISLAVIFACARRILGTDSNIELYDRR